jgi:exodeoxyribonuclease V alpha subunit
MSASLQNTSTTLPESLSGLIERVAFQNDENGWVVLKVKTKGHRDLVAVVGSLPSVRAGEWLTAQGRWVQDREFGLHPQPISGCVRGSPPGAVASSGANRLAAGPRFS